MSDPYVGEIRPFTYPNFIPEGWLACNGTQQPIMQFQALYVVIGNMYGATDGRTYFTLPNFQGFAPMGAGAQQPGWVYSSPPTPGKTYGYDKVQVGASGMGAHTHALSMAGGPTSLVMQSAPGPQQIPFRPFNTTAQKTYKGWSTATPVPTTIMDAATIASEGAAMPDSHENRQPFLALNFAICWRGIFPVAN